VLRIVDPNPYRIKRLLPQKAHWGCYSARPFFQVWNGHPRSPTVCHATMSMELTMSKTHSKQCSIRNSVTQFCGGRNPKTSAGVHHRIFGEQQLSYSCSAASQYCINYSSASTSNAKKSPSQPLEAGLKSVASLKWPPLVWVVCSRVVDLTTDTTCMLQENRMTCWDAFVNYSRSSS